MPTGYTAKLYDGEQSFEDFVLGCARAFGAYIHQRDDDTNTPNRDPEFNSYHERRLDEGYKELETYTKMDLVEAKVRSDEEYKANVASINKANEEMRQRQERYDDMLELVKDWKPPTNIHQNLKDFMIEQITISSDNFVMKLPEEIDGYEWRQERINSCLKNIKYHSEELLKDRMRHEERMAWIKALKESLGV